MAKAVVLFDLGGTLVEFYGTGEFGPILETAIHDVYLSLQETETVLPRWDDVWQRVLVENHEASDFRVRPLEGRLSRIFGLAEFENSGMSVQHLCRTFMAPIFRRARVYEDSIPVLMHLRSMGVRVAIVSNTPWGSPAEL